MKFNLVENMPYRVTHRTWDNSRRITAKREFLFTEKRFGDIPCYCFSSRITKRPSRQLVSIPEYDLIKVEKVGG
jgi:hypothetical protein